MRVYTFLHPAGLARSPLRNQQIYTGVKVEGPFQAYKNEKRCFPALGSVLTFLAQVPYGWKQQALLTTITVLDDRISSRSLLMKQLLRPPCERVTRRATTQGPIRCKRELTQNSLAGNPKRLRPNCLSTAGPTAQTTPLLRVAQKPWSGHPWCGRPADYLPSGTLGQWPPATVQWWTSLKGGDPKTDQASKGADSELPGWQPKETASQLPQGKGTLEPAWVVSLHKREGAQGPQCAKQRLTAMLLRLFQLADGEG